MKSLILKTTLAGSLLAATAFVSPATAEEKAGLIPGEFTANIALTTNYIFRGVTQTGGADLEGGDPAIQGGFDYSYNIFYAGIWASNVDFGDDTGIEIDYYLGVAPEFNGITWDTGVLFYTYPDSTDAGGEQDFIEFYTGLSGTLAEMLDWGASVAFSDDFYLESGQALYYSFEAGIPVGEYFGIDAHYGYSDFDAGGDYGDWNVGITTEFEGFGLDLRYGDTDISGLDTDTVWFTISKSL